jgi:hypothetical protein
MPKRRFCFWALHLVILVAMGVTQPAVAKPRDMSLYTLRLHIFESDWKPSAVGGSGTGNGNLFDGTEIHGVSFTYFCPINYMRSVGSQAYAARWKKPGKKIEIVGSPVGGGDKSDTCEFNVTLHDFVYDVQNGTLATFTPEQYKVRTGMALPKNEKIDGSLGDYPVRLSVLEINWNAPLNGTRSASGRGNLRSESKISSVDFTTDCNAAFPASGDGRYYAGKWSQGEGSALTLLLMANGAAMTCTLKTSVHTDVYVKDAAGSIRAVSAEEYRHTAMKQSSPATPDN